MTIPNKFRESKYLNESGTKKGNWFLNRLDYFQFHEYPEYKKHKLLSLVLTVTFVYLFMKTASVSFLSSLIFIYLTYVSAKTFYVLHTRICRHRGYFLYPKRIVKFLKSIEVEVELNDFDSVATMNRERE